MISTTCCASRHRPPWRSPLRSVTNVCPVSWILSSDDPAPRASRTCSSRSPSRGSPSSGSEATTALHASCSSAPPAAAADAAASPRAAARMPPRPTPSEPAAAPRARALRLLEEAPAEARRAGTAARRAEHRGVARRVGLELVLLHPQQHVRRRRPLVLQRERLQHGVVRVERRAHRAPRHLLQALPREVDVAVLRHPQRGVHQLVALQRLRRHHQLAEQLARERAIRRAQQVQALALGEDDGAGGAAHRGGRRCAAAAVLRTRSHDDAAVAVFLEARAP